VQVILDTNIFVGDFLRRGSVAALLEQAKREKIVLLVPRVVVYEAGRQYAKKLREALEKARKPNERLRDLGVSVDISSVDLATAADEYEQQLRYALREVGAQVLDYPAVSHEHIADRAVSRKKPFADDGRGYADTLIWLTLLERLQFGPAILVSTNTSDFADPDSPELARSLVAEVERAGFPPSSARLVTSVRLLLSELAATNDSVRAEVEDFLADEGIWEFLAEHIGEEADHALRGDLALNDLLGDADTGWVEVSSVNVRDIDAVDAHEAGERQVLVYLNAEIDAVVTLFREEPEEGDVRVYERPGIDASPIPEERSLSLSAEVAAIFDFATNEVHEPELVKLVVRR
jgi:hypothetical protein